MIESTRNHALLQVPKLTILFINESIHKHFITLHFLFWQINFLHLFFLTCVCVCVYYNLTCGTEQKKIFVHEYFINSIFYNWRHTRRHEAAKKIYLFINNNHEECMKRNHKLYRNHFSLIWYCLVWQ